MKLQQHALLRRLMLSSSAQNFAGVLDGQEERFLRKVIPAVSACRVLTRGCVLPEEPGALRGTADPVQESSGSAPVV